MSFSTYAWHLYRESREGQLAIGRAASEHAAAVAPSGIAPVFEYPLWLVRLKGGEQIGDAIQTEETVTDIREFVHGNLADETVESIDEAENLFTSIVDDGLTWEQDDEDGQILLLYAGGSVDPRLVEDVYSSVQALTIGLHECFPEFFFPYLFARRFDHLQEIGNRYEVDLPEVPGKLQKRERSLYYVGVNRAFQEFRRRVNLSAVELNAFLYDFAPKDICRDNAEPLPQPSRIWFVMGGKNAESDFDFLDGADETTVGHWQGNLETRRGDIVLMWCVSPRSYLHSVWRAVNDGFNDPYFFYYSTIRLGKPIRIPSVTFSELSTHELFSKHPAVKSHFQGRNGMPFTVEEYLAICNIVESKGMETSSLPAPPEEVPLPNIELTTERDVEVHLIEPLLRRLGYADTDWHYQPRIRMGRGERNVPDYVLGASGKTGEESGVALIESKFDISTSRDRREAFLQGRSYALRLQVTVLALAARQGIWLYRLTGHGFDEDQFLFKNWHELENPDKFVEVERLLGKRTVDREIVARKRRRSSPL